MSDNLPPKKQFSILIVDDEPLIRELTSLMLGDSGLDAELTEAEDGVQAWELLQKKRFDLVLTDIKMPQMDGLELCQKISENRIPTEIIVITGHGGVEECKSAMKFGVFDLISKPMDQELLNVRVKNALEHRQLLRSITEVFQLISDGMGMKEKSNFETMSVTEQLRLVKAISGYMTMKFSRTAS